MEVSALRTSIARCDNGTNLRNVRPWQWAPGEVVEDDEEVDQSDRRNARACDATVSRSGIRLDQCCGGDLAGCHTYGASCENSLAWDVVGNEDDEGGTCCDLDSTEDGSQEEIRVSFIADEKSEVLRSVIRECCCPSCLLSDEDRDGGQCASGVALVQHLCHQRISACLLWLAKTTREHTLGMKSFSGVSLALHTKSDLLHLVGDIVVVTGTNPLKTLPGIIVATFHRKPSRAFFQSQGPYAQESGEEHLEADGDLPLAAVGIRDVSGDSPIRPVGCENAEREHELVETPDLSTDLFWRHLGAEHRHDYAAASEPNACYYSAHVEHGPAVRVSGLHRGSDDENEGTDGDCIAPAQPVSDRPDGEAGHESTKLLQADGER